MKSRLCALRIGALGFVALASVSHAGAPKARSPLLGTWALEVARMPVPAEARPKSVTITFAEADQGKWSTKVDIIDNDGSERHMGSAYTVNGAAVTIEGDQLEADTASVAIPAPRTMIMALAKAAERRPGSTRVYSVSEDRRRMTETAVSWDDNGIPMMRTSYFVRVARK
ncbi:MAG: hypothetical protein HOO94_01765 [Novosphingobium sp.]|uniref:hypothetical protein n=1 Tax=Novosphingobium sp. TaxID=1874826 RepID=UPI001829CCD5|nr:hypothetical protein [Novosphingobium sp.]